MFLRTILAEGSIFSNHIICMDMDVIYKIRIRCFVMVGYGPQLLVDTVLSNTNIPKMNNIAMSAQ